MTEPLGKTTYWKGRQRTMEIMTQDNEGNGRMVDPRILMGEVDFGGPDGHVAEVGDWAELKYVQGTRCSTTRSAITAYFCGADVAENQDVGLDREHRKGVNYGVTSFSKYLACRHKKGEQEQKRQQEETMDGGGGGHHHQRSVYRLGIGCQDNLAGYSHAFSIIAQPDGTYYWLQSYIGEYSLPQWMSLIDPLDGTPRAHILTLEELQSKLYQVKRLMNINSWTEQANQDYYELFGVNKARDGKTVHDWDPSHRLDLFTWDKACEYPLPSSSSSSSSEQQQQKSSTGWKYDEDYHDADYPSLEMTFAANGFDECDVENVWRQIPMAEAKEILKNKNDETINKAELDEILKKKKKNAETKVETATNPKASKRKNRQVGPNKAQIESDKSTATSFGGSSNQPGSSISLAASLQSDIKKKAAESSEAESSGTHGGSPRQLGTKTI